jgi:hypothetical protein
MQRGRDRGVLSHYSAASAIEIIRSNERTRSSSRTRTQSLASGISRLQMGESVTRSPTRSSSSSAFNFLKSKRFDNKRALSPSAGVASRSSLENRPPWLKNFYKGDRPASPTRSPSRRPSEKLLSPKPFAVSLTAAAAPKSDAVQFEAVTSVPQIDGEQKVGERKVVTDKEQLKIAEKSIDSLDNSRILGGVTAIRILLSKG